MIAVLIAAHFIIERLMNPPMAINAGMPLYFHTINVGDGECLVVEFQDGKILMIDTGAESYFDTVIDYLDANLSFNTNFRYDRMIDYLIITHPDTDHYGGIYKMFDFCSVVNIYRPYFDSGSGMDDALPAVTGITDTEQAKFDTAAENLGRAVDAMYAEAAENNGGVYTASAGVVIDGGEYNYKITIHAPTDGAMDFDGTDDLDKSTAVAIINGMSPIITIEYSSVVFVLTGDATEQALNLAAETDSFRKIFAAEKRSYGAVILKVPNHGSGTQWENFGYYAPDFYEFIFGGVQRGRAFAVISCGGGRANNYPHPNVRWALNEYCGKVLVTNEIGHIKIYTDSFNIQVNDGKLDIKYISETVFYIYIVILVLIIVLCFYNYGRHRHTDGACGTGTITAERQKERGSNEK
jgi:beta-lactamase superfamily II metal-dependent hydrolase